LAERFAADESANGGSRMRGWLLSCAIGQRQLAWPFHTRLLDAGTDLAGYDRRGDAAKRKAADLVHVPFFPRQA